MNTSVIRQIWSLVELTQSHFLLNLDDQHLVDWLMQELRQQYPMTPDTEKVARSYLVGKLTLIRDLARSRLSFVCSTV